MDVLVTGGAGYLGSIVCANLLTAGHAVHCLDTMEFGSAPVDVLRVSPRFTVTAGSILDADLVKRAVRRCEAVIHLAGLNNDASCDRFPDLARSLNVEAALSLAEGARASGCHRFVNASSCSVYGWAVDEVVDESSATRPVSLYASLKLELEAGLARLATADFRVVNLRQATLFGPSSRMRYDLVLNAMTMAAMTTGRITVRGGGRQWRPLLHVQDAARAFASALALPVGPAAYHTLNLGSNRNNYRIVELARIVQTEFPDISVDVCPEPADPRSYRVRFDAAEAALGWRALRGPADGVREIKHAFSRMPPALPSRVMGAR